PFLPPAASSRLPAKSASCCASDSKFPQITPTADSRRPIVDHHTSHNISPPTPVLRAWRPVITPRGVVRMLIPRPPSTRGISVWPTYTRHPGRETRDKFVIAASLLEPYFKYNRSTLCPPSSVALKLERYPSSFRMRAISTFSFDVGTSSFCWRALIALRIRVNK